MESAAGESQYMRNKYSVEVFVACLLRARQTNWTYYVRTQTSYLVICVRMKPDLKFFVLQGESKRLYKRFMGLTKKVEDKQQRKDLRLWIRDDFRINKNLTDYNDIKSQHIRARTALEELEVSIDLSRARKDNT